MMFLKISLNKQDRVRSKHIHVYKLMVAFHSRPKQSIEMEMNETTKIEDMILFAIRQR